MTTVAGGHDPFLKSPMPRFNLGDLIEGARGAFHQSYMNSIERRKAALDIDYLERTHEHRVAQSEFDTDRSHHAAEHQYQNARKARHEADHAKNQSWSSKAAAYQAWQKADPDMTHPDNPFRVSQPGNPRQAPTQPTPASGQTTNTTNSNGRVRVTVTRLNTPTNPVRPRTGHPPPQRPAIGMDDS